jgi:hypothetical protein
MTLVRRLPSLQHIHNIIHFPKSGSHSCCHRWRNFERAGAFSIATNQWGKFLLCTISSRRALAHDSIDRGPADLQLSRDLSRTQA